MEIQIYFQIRSQNTGKYFRNQRKIFWNLISQLREVHHIQISWTLEEFQKVGLMAVEQYVEFLKKFTPVITNLPVGPCSNHPREAGSRHLFRSKRLEDPQADNRKPNQLTQFYSRQWHMDHGLWTLLLYFVR